MTNQEQHAEDSEGLTGTIIGAFYDCYNDIGPGHSERVYTNALVVAFQYLGVRYAREVRYPVIYRGVEVGLYRADLVVEQRVIVEIKTAESIAKEHIRQVISYLNASRLFLGLLLNFGPAPTIKRVSCSRPEKK